MEIGRETEQTQLKIHIVLWNCQIQCCKTQLCPSASSARFCTELHTLEFCQHHNAMLVFSKTAEHTLSKTVESICTKFMKSESGHNTNCFQDSQLSISPEPEWVENL